MLVLITYDVSTITSAGQRRLRKVSKVCQNYGQRVQNSVFECVVDAAQFTSLKLELTAIIDESQDSLRFYQLGNNYKSKVEHLGIKESLDLEGPLIL
jgi:CRISPR-associated protein Cas2